MSDNGGYAIYYVLLLVLVASSLIGLRMPLGKALKVVLELAVSPVHIFVSRHVLQQRPELLKRLNQGVQRARQRPQWQQVLARYPGA